MVCIKKYSLDDGVKVDYDPSVCKSGSIYNKDGQSYCATIKSKGQCKEDTSAPGTYIYDLTLSLGGDTDEVIPQKCTCYSSDNCEYEEIDLTDDSKEFINYKDSYLKKLDDLIKDDDTDFRTIDDDYLNDKNLLEKYVLYKYKDKIPSGDDKECVFDFFMTVTKNSSSYLKISFFTVLALLLFI